MSDFFSLYQQNLATLRENREPEYERNFLERVFAPFQAPQETLFSATKEIAEDGFQARDLWTAMSHGARYFNPWSDEKPIDPDEIRQIFFGEEAEGTLKFGQNLAISLLYDPLLFTGLLKGVGVAGKGVNALQKALNPAELVIDGMRLASKNVVGPAARTAAYKVLGAERAERWGVSLAQNWFRKYAGIDEDLIREATTRDSRLNAWRDEGYRVIKKSQQLGGAEAQRLLTQALEMDAAYIRHGGGTLTDDMARSLDLLDSRIDRMGIDRDLFWQNYANYRNLDDTIGKELLNTGAINTAQFEELRGTHLRRIYQATERPLEYAKRVEDLNIPDVVQANKKVLFNNLNEFRDDLTTQFRNGSTGSPSSGQSALFGMADTFAGNNPAAAARYFEDGTAGGRFNTKHFVDDLDEWLRNNSTSSIDDVLAHVKNDMLGGMNLTPEFHKTLANHISTGGVTVRKGSQFYSDMIRGWANNPSMTWRTYNERLQVVSERSDIPEVIREAMGEVLEAAPRMAAEVTDAGRLLENRRFLDTVAGAKRIDDDTMELIRRAEKLGFETQDADRLITQAAEKLKMDKSELIEALPQVLEEGTGIRVGSKGSGWASVASNPEKGHTVRIPDHASYGEMAGMFVSPATASLIRHLEGTGEIANETAKMWMKTGDLISQGVSHFKVMKVLLDPTAQVRNFIGNAVLMDMSGTSPFRVDLLSLAARELTQYGRNQELGKYMQLANDAGVSMFQTTFSKAELGDFARRVAIDPGKVENWRDVITKAHSSLQRSGLDPMEAASKAFEFNERLFKLTVFTDRVRRLETAAAKAGKSLTPELMQDFARQAGSIAEQALFNYADIPYMVDFTRKYGIVPFITFPFKAVPFVADTLYKNPHRVLKYDRIVDVANAELAGTSVDAAREIEALPQHVRERMVVKLPFEDAHGRPQYLDLSYFMPWAVIADFKKMLEPSEDMGGGAGFREGMLTPPAQALIDAVRYNKDSLGRSIVDPNRNAAQNFGAIGSFLWKFIAPPSAPGGSRADSIGRAMQAMATTNPEAMAWSNAVGAAYRGAPFFPEYQERILASDGFFPQTQSQLQTEGVGQPLGFLFGALAGGAVASDRTQALNQEAAKYSGNRTEAYKDIASIRSDRSLSIGEKNKRIRRIMEALQEAGRDTAERVRSL